MCKRSHTGNVHTYVLWFTGEEPFITFDELFEDSEFYGQTYMLQSIGDLRLTVGDKIASRGRAGRLEVRKSHIQRVEFQIEISFSLDVCNMYGRFHLSESSDLKQCHKYCIVGYFRIIQCT